MKYSDEQSPERRSRIGIRNDFNIQHISACVA
jgi:hypothetical protein